MDALPAYFFTNINQLSMKVTCVNDKCFPNEIPKSKRVIAGQDYTVIKVMKCNSQGGIIGYEIEEISLAGCEPYLYFSADRFAVPTPDEVMVEEEESAIV